MNESITKVGMSTVRIQVKVPAEWAAKLVAQAKMRGSTVSAEVRDILKAAMNTATDERNYLHIPYKILEEFSGANEHVSSAGEIPPGTQPIRSIYSPHMKQHGHDPCWVTKGEKHHQCLKCCTCGKK